jgi:tRNA/tmRNA/rRNA uracil-C5-methylase (TrmA/RlmC/RlmD family)
MRHAVIDADIKSPKTDAMDNASALAFAEAAPFYGFRAPYAPDAIEYVKDLLGIDKSSRAVGLGCGPGTLTIPMAQRAGHLLAVDLWHGGAQNRKSRSSWSRRNSSCCSGWPT